MCRTRAPRQSGRSHGRAPCARKVAHPMRYGRCYAPPVCARPAPPAAVQHNARARAQPPEHTRARLPAGPRLDPRNGNVNAFETESETDIGNCAVLLTVCCVRGRVHCRALRPRHALGLCCVLCAMCRGTASNFLHRFSSGRVTFRLVRLSTQGALQLHVNKLCNVRAGMPPSAPPPPD